MKYRQTFTYRLLSAWLSMVLAVTFAIPVRAQSGLTLNLPAPGQMINLSPAFSPVMLKGLKVFADEPLRFDFIVDTGETGLQGNALEQESNRLIKYFLASLTVPEDDLWVNLSPYEKDRIIPEKFGQTEMGRDLLAQDYLLKQLTASLLYPQDDLGEAFWTEVYARAQKKYGITDVPINTFNKVWIVPQKAVVYENGDTAFVVESHLKVMLEEDYLAMEKNNGGFYGAAQEENNQIGAQVIREMILPEIEREVNEGTHFAKLRQIYNSLILAEWFRRNLKASLLGQVYMEQNKIDGVDIEDKKAREKIYGQYLAAFKQGVYDVIKEDYDPAAQAMIPRKYFSGGIEFRRNVDFGQLAGVYAETTHLAQMPDESRMVRLKVSASPKGRLDAAMVGNSPAKVVEDQAQRVYSSSFTQPAFIGEAIATVSLKDRAMVGDGAIESVLPNFAYDEAKDSIDLAIDYARKEIHKGNIRNAQNILISLKNDLILARIRNQIFSLIEKWKRLFPSIGANDLEKTYLEIKDKIDAIDKLLNVVNQSAHEKWQLKSLDEIPFGKFHSPYSLFFDLKLLVETELEGYVLQSNAEVVKIVDSQGKVFLAFGHNFKGGFYIESSFSRKALRNILTQTKSEGRRLMSQLELDVLNRQEGAFIFQAQETWSAMPANIYIKEGSFNIQMGQFGLFDASVYPNPVIRTDRLSTCTGVGVKINNFYGLGHVFLPFSANKETLYDHLKFIHNQLLARGFSRQDMTYLIDYRENAYEGSAEAIETEIRDSDLFKGIPIIFHRRSEGEFEIMIIDESGVDIIPHKDSKYILFQPIRYAWSPEPVTAPGGIDLTTDNLPLETQGKGMTGEVKTEMVSTTADESFSDRDFPFEELTGVKVGDLRNVVEAMDSAEEILRRVIAASSRYKRSLEMSASFRTAFEFGFALLLENIWQHGYPLEDRSQNLRIRIFADNKPFEGMRIEFWQPGIEGHGIPSVLKQKKWFNSNDRPWEGRKVPQEGIFENYGKLHNGMNIIFDLFSKIEKKWANGFIYIGWRDVDGNEGGKTDGQIIAIHIPFRNQTALRVDTDPAMVGGRLTEEHQGKQGNLFFVKKTEVAATASAPGGIDLTTDNLPLETQGKGMTVLPVFFEDLQGMDPAMISGFEPIIIQMVPMTDLPMFLGLKDDNDVGLDLLSVAQ